MIDIQTILTYLTLISVPVGVFYHIMTLNNQTRTQKLQLETRQASLFTQIYNKFGEVEFARNHTEIMKWSFKNYDEWIEKYGSETNPEANAQWMSVARFFHGVGVLVDRGLVDVQLVYDLMGDPVIQTWEKMGILTLAVRERMGSPDHGQAFESLYNKLIEIKQ